MNVVTTTIPEILVIEPKVPGVTIRLEGFEEKSTLIAMHSADADPAARREPNAKDYPARGDQRSH
jgi:hypothetical protein